MMTAKANKVVRNFVSGTDPISKSRQYFSIILFVFVFFKACSDGNDQSSKASVIKNSSTCLGALGHLRQMRWRQYANKYAKFLKEKPNDLEGWFTEQVRKTIAENPYGLTENSVSIILRDKEPFIEMAPRFGVTDILFNEPRLLEGKKSMMVTFSVERWDGLIDAQKFTIPRLSNMSVMDLAYDRTVNGVKVPTRVFKQTDTGLESILNKVNDREFHIAYSTSWVEKKIHIKKLAHWDISRIVYQPSVEHIVPNRGFRIIYNRRGAYYMSPLQTSTDFENVNNVLLQLRKQAKSYRNVPENLVGHITAWVGGLGFIATAVIVTGMTSY